MPTISTLTVDVTTNTSKFSKGLKIAASGLAALATGAVYAFKQFEDADKVVRQTDAVLTSTGGAANVTAAQVNNLGNALSKKSAIDDEVIQSGENMLLTFRNIRNEVGKGNDIFTQTVRVTTDVAAAMAAASGSGVNLKATAIQIGKAMNNPIKGMSSLMRVGVQFTAQQTEQIKKMVESGNLMGAQKIILGELTTEFGGSAKANATASAAMGVAVGNLAEAVGKVLAPALSFAATKLTEFIGFLQANAGPAFRAMIGWFQGIWEKIQPVATLVGGSLLDAWRALSDAFKRILPDLQKLWNALQPLAKVIGTVIGAVLVLALKALPYVISALGIAIDWIVKFETFLYKLINTVGGVVIAVINWFQRLPDAIRTILDRINGWFGGWPGKILGFIGNLGRLLFDVGKQIIQGLWDGMKSVWRSLTGWIGSIGGWIADLKGPMNKDKVLLTKQGEAIIGGLQAGMQKGWAGVRNQLGGFNAELAVSGGGGGGVGGTTINVYANAIATERQLEDLIHDALLRKGRRVNTLALNT